MSSSYINPALGNIRDNLNKVIQSGNKITLHTYTKAFYVQGENTNFNDITTFERVEISPISEDSTQIKFESFDSAPDANGYHPDIAKVKAIEPKADGKYDDVEINYVADPVYPEGNDADANTTTDKKASTHNVSKKKEFTSNNAVKAKKQNSRNDSSNTKSLAANAALAQAAKLHSAELDSTPVKAAAQAMHNESNNKKEKEELIHRRT